MSRTEAVKFIRFCGDFKREFPDENYEINLMKVEGTLKLNKNNTINNLYRRPNF